MCAIFGFAGFEDERLLGRMARVLAHRGPDGSGFFTQAPGGAGAPFAMGMCRLSIIDLEGGNQPIYNETGDLVVCYNGEIYNYVELAEELESRGHRFMTRSDTEVIVHGFEEWGPACLERFNGMFAFALFDRRSGQLFLARDRCGQKPLYYWRDGRVLVFASEVKALLECPRVPRACNLEAIDPYLAFRYVPEPQTMFEGVFTVPAAHSLTRNPDGEIRVGRYWDIDLSDHGEPATSAGWQDRVEAVLRDSVRLTMRSDVPVAGYLSGGVDSSLIVALMREHSALVKTYSIGFGAPGDETADAAETARLLGTDHHEVLCRPADFDLLPDVVYHMDRPVGDALIIAFYRLAQETSKDVKVVLSGEGADEIFAGYSFHKVILAFELYRRTVPAFLHRGVAMPLLRGLPVDFLNKFFVFPAHLGTQGKNRLVDFAGHYAGRDLFANYAALKTLFSHAGRRALYSGPFKARATEAWMPGVRDPGGRFLDRLLKLQWDEWLQDWCIIRQDKNTMAHSLEVRLPFLDHRLIELAFQVPPRLKANPLHDKIIERRVAAKLLPEPVVKRKKNPFFLPMEFFFEHPQVHQLVRETLNPAAVHARGYFDPSRVAWLVERMQTREFVYLKQVMALVILELWHRRFIDR